MPDDDPREVAARYVERLHAMGHAHRKAYCGAAKLRHDGCAVCEASAAHDVEGIGEDDTEAAEARAVLEARMPSLERTADTARRADAMIAEYERSAAEREERER